MQMKQCPILHRKSNSEGGGRKRDRVELGDMEGRQAPWQQQEDGAKLAPSDGWCHRASLSLHVCDRPPWLHMPSAKRAQGPTLTASHV